MMLIDVTLRKNKRGLPLTMRSEAFQAFSSLALNKSAMKIGRSLQTLSISHCLARRLRKAFDSFKILLSSFSVDEARRWFSKRLLSVIFGKWAAFAHREQRIENKFYEKGASLHTVLSLRRYQKRVRSKRLQRCQSTEKEHSGVAFFAFLWLLTSFEKFSRMRSMKRSARDLFDSADSYINRRRQAKCLALWRLRAQTTSRLRETCVATKVDLEHRRLKRSLLLWQHYALKRRKHRTIDQDILCKYRKEALLCVGTPGLDSSVWCVKSCIRTLAALKKFSMKKDFMAPQRCVQKRYTRYTGVKAISLRPVMAGSSGRVSHREAAEVQAVMMLAALQRWSEGLQKRLLKQPMLSMGEEHWKAEGRYTCLARVITALQRKLKRTFMESRRFSLATLSIHHGLLRVGLERLIQFAKKKKPKDSSMLTADFRLEMSRFATGFSALRTHTDLRANVQMAYMKAAVVWKVTRSLLALRSWGQWVVRKRERRAMHLASGRTRQRNIEDKANQLWLTLATNSIYKEQAQRVLFLARWVAKKWKAYVLRNKFLRQRKILLPLSNPPNSNRPAASVRLSHTDLLEEVDLVKARPRTLDSSTYGCFHVPYSSSIIMKSSSSNSSNSSSRNSSSSSSGTDGSNIRGKITSNHLGTDTYITYGLSGVPAVSMLPTASVSCEPAAATAHHSDLSRHRELGDKGAGLAYMAPRLHSFSQHTPHNDHNIKLAPSHCPQDAAPYVNMCSSSDTRDNGITSTAISQGVKKSTRLLLAEEIISFVMEVQNSNRIMLPV